MRRVALFLPFFLALASCVERPSAPPAPAAQTRQSLPPSSELPSLEAPTLNLAAVSYEALPGWRADHVSAALPALKRSCAKLAAEPPATHAGPVGTRLAVGDWRPACAALARVRDRDDDAARAYFERWFQPYRASDQGAVSGIFTGYFQIELRGARHRGGRYTVPLYGVPRDLVTIDHVTGREVASARGAAIEPYPTRAEIEAGAIADRAPVLAWVDDPIAAYFLSVQGSGRVAFEDGSTLALGYAATNGRPYRSIGKILVARGAMSLESTSLQSIGAWLRHHPGEAKALMNENPAYVFYRRLGSDGPIGTEGVALTSGRSLAVDPRYVPLGAPVWLDVDGVLGPTRIRRLVIAQDTGSAIKGPVRGDLFWGYGAQAERMAGHMRAAGGYFLLLPRAPAP